MAGLLTVFGDLPKSLHDGCGICCGKMPFGDAGRGGVGDAPYSPGKMPCCETLGGENIVGTTFETKFSKTPNLVELVGPLLSGLKLMGPWPGGGAEGMGVHGSLTCCENPLPCAAGAAGKGLSGSCGMPRGEGNLTPSAFC